MLSGDTLGKYRLVSRLGRGGMGEVWLAKASGYGGFSKTVVLKTLLPELASDPLFVELLAREAKVCATLSHPNLIEVFDFTKQDGVYLLAMEHVLGQPLNAIMKAAYSRGWGIPAWFALRVAWDCCCGLQAAHDNGVIHCDLSPSNVMVTYTGATKVLDFGVAHTAALGPKSDRLKGKFSYMAPERIRTRATDRRTDIYALGVMLYLLFTGQLPFVGENDGELLHKITHEKLVCPSSLVDIDPQIEQVILRAMHADPSKRFQTIAEVLEALAPCLDGQLGTYGQQHVAAFVNALFGPQSVVAQGPSQLPRVPSPARADGTLEPVDHEVMEALEVLEEIDVDIDIDAAAVPRRQLRDTATAQVVKPAAARPRPLGSTEMAPIPKKPLISAFAQAAGHVEPKTSVQSLFGERPTQVSKVAGLFARGTREDLEASHPFARQASPEPAPVPEPRPIDAPEDPREKTRRVFGEYAVRRVKPDVVMWPWPSSRSKSE